MEKRNKKSNNISKAVKEVWEKRKESNAIPSKSNGIPKESKRKRKEIPMGIVNVNINEVKDYFKEKGYTEISAIKFFEYYSVADWKDSNGKLVKNWKQKAQSVWFTDENKIKEVPIGIKSVAEQMEEMRKHGEK